ncbi:MAG: hypothetical protein J5850_06385 [Clostridia bacterium]|nr:hypothetical protein [Clostridia bacterium]
METLYTFIFISVILIYDNTGSAGTDMIPEEHEYIIGGAKYTVAALYDGNSGFTLYERFKRILEFNISNLTRTYLDDTMKPEYVSAVGKDENGRDSNL